MVIDGTPPLMATGMDAVVVHPWTDGPPPVVLMGAWPIHALTAPCMVDPWMGIINV